MGDCLGRCIGEIVAAVIGPFYKNSVVSKYGVKCRCCTDEESGPPMMVSLGVLITAVGFLSACPLHTSDSDGCGGEVCTRIFCFPCMFMVSFFMVITGFIFLALDAVFFLIAIFIAIFTCSRMVFSTEVHASGSWYNDDEGEVLNVVVGEPNGSEVAYNNMEASAPSPAYMKVTSPNPVPPS
eukprot:TRINITY_DN6271_c0_g1_i1.p1 TRINITY_DN6271_c0_g1~~TRINITY_DN6271_c0_g1_i1.p1  ORF type:complete len:182 (-),score=32.44 TRINITY_DN6271_c0_g1_i1:183-728(-)